MDRRIWVIGVALVGLGLVGAAIGLWAGPSPSSPPASVVASPDPVEADDPPEAPVVERRRVPIPKPTPAPEPAEARAERAGTAEDRGPAGDTDDFPAVQGASTDLATDLKAAMQEVTPGLIECLAGWHEAQSDVFVGRAIFAFQLDEDGIAEMDVLDVEAVPEGTLTCLGDVLWEEVEWPSVEGSLEVTWPIQVSVADD